MIDLDSLPETENERFKFESSRVTFEDLRQRIQIVGSAFWNSGGGYCLWGVDENGKPDGGVAPRMGAGQTVAAWLQNVLTGVTPVGDYEIGAARNRIGIDADKQVFILQFKESQNPPHMAPDGRYYIRLGVEMAPARQYLVDALYAHRGMRQPQILPMLRGCSDDPNTINLELIATNEVPAINVVLKTDTQLSGIPAQQAETLIPIVDRVNPFVVPAVFFSKRNHSMSDAKPITVQVEYESPTSRRRIRTRVALDPNRVPRTRSAESR